MRVPKEQSIQFRLNRMEELLSSLDGNGGLSEEDIEALLRRSEAERKPMDAGGVTPQQLGEALKGVYGEKRWVYVCVFYAPK